MFENLRIVGTVVIVGVILAFLTFTSSKISGYNKAITGLREDISDLESKNKNLNDQLQRQNEEIRIKDEFIEKQQEKRTQIRINKQVARAMPLDDISSWLLVNCTNGKVC